MNYFSAIFYSFLIDYTYLCPISATEKWHKE